MLTHRLRRFANNKPTLVQLIVFAEFLIIHNLSFTRWGVGATIVSHALQRENYQQ